MAKQVNDRTFLKDDGLHLRSANLAELALVNITIDEEDDKREEGWTSKMGLNLRNCVRSRRESPMNNQRLRLDLGGCFSSEEQVPWPDASTLKWLSRRTRSQLGSKDHTPTKKPQVLLTRTSEEPRECKLEEIPESPAQKSSISPSELCPTLPMKHYERRRKKKMDPQQVDEDHGCISFVRSPCEGLRPRSKPAAPLPEKSGTTATKHECKIEGCSMMFQTEKELKLHRKNWCTVKGCRKRFSSHKYAVRHQCVHEEGRPLKCSWKGCEMSFKWAWARTEHLRIHTGERPYLCSVDGCGKTFRFVSDFSRHRRRTGHCFNGR